MIRPWRRFCQISVALAFMVIPLLNIHDIMLLSGNLLSFNMAGLPLADPLATLQAAVGSGGSATTTMLLGAGLPLLLALLLGRVFCSWLCPYGLLSELAVASKRRSEKNGPSAAKLSTSELSASALAAPELSASAAITPAKAGQKRTITPTHIRLSLVMAGLAFILLVAPVPVLNQLSLPGWYSRFWQHGAFYGTALWGAALIPALLLAEYFLGKRLWCRYLCPQALLISLLAALPFGLRRRFKREACSCARSQRACLPACHLGLDPRRQNAQNRLECSNCGDCVDACRKNGKALSLGITF